MSQPAGFTTYYLIDDTAPGNPGGATPSGGSGAQLTPDFVAGSLADAQTVAQHFSTLFNRDVRLVQKGGSPPWTPVFSPSGCKVLPSAVPNSITF